jgi:hypothetical protein
MPIHFGTPIRLLLLSLERPQVSHGIIFYEDYWNASEVHFEPHLR